MSQQEETLIKELTLVACEPYFGRDFGMQQAHPLTISIAQTINYLIEKRRLESNKKKEYCELACSFIYVIPRSYHYQYVSTMMHESGYNMTEISRIIAKI